VRGIARGAAGGCCAASPSTVVGRGGGGFLAPAAVAPEAHDRDRRDAAQDGEDRERSQAPPPTAPPGGIRPACPKIVRKLGQVDRVVLEGRAHSSTESIECSRPPRALGAGNAQRHPKLV